MTRRGMLTLALLAAPLIVGCDQEVLAVTVVRSGEQRIEANERLRGALLLLGGQLAVAPGARIDGPLIVTDGTLTLAGEIAGDATLAGGALRLASGARIGGAVHHLGGALERHPDAQVAGGVLDERNNRLPARMTIGLFGLDSTASSWLWSAGQAALAALLAWLLARLAPRPLARVTNAVRRHPLPVAALGALAGVVGLVLIVVMTFTLVLLPVALLTLLLTGVVLGYGWAALGALLAGIARSARQRESAGPGSGATALATFGLLLGLELLQSLPGGGLAALAAAALGIGGVLATRFGTQRFAPAP